jgi:hypothetical protein
MLIGAKSLDLVSWVKAQLLERYKMTDLGEAKSYIGISIYRDRELGKMWLGQPKYCIQLAQKFGLENAVHPRTPLPYGFRLHFLHELSDCSDSGPAPVQNADDRAGKEYVDEECSFEEHKRFQQIVGSLLHAAHYTRIDIAHAVGQLSRCMQRSYRRHLAAAEHCVRYLAGTAHLGIEFSREQGSLLEGSCDSDHQKCHSSKSITGYILSVGGGPVWWSSKKQDRVTNSSCESEAQAMVTTVQMIEFARQQLEELGAMQIVPTPIYCDNSSTVRLSKDPVSHEKTKQLRKVMHYVREQADFGVIDPSWIPTKSQKADFLTKEPKTIGEFETCRSLAGMTPIPDALLAEERKDA